MVSWKSDDGVLDLDDALGLMDKAVEIFFIIFFPSSWTRRCSMRWEKKFLFNFKILLFFKYLSLIFIFKMN